MNTITREQIIQKMELGEPMKIIEALPAKYFLAEHLPGAINIPHDSIREKAPEAISEKNMFTIVYCSNTQCQNSKIASETLRKMGYTRVYEYVEGKQDWLEANLPVEKSK